MPAFALQYLWRLVIITWIEFRLFNLAVEAHLAMAFGAKDGGVWSLSLANRFLRVQRRAKAIIDG